LSNDGLCKGNSKWRACSFPDTGENKRNCNSPLLYLNESQENIKVVNPTGKLESLYSKYIPLHYKKPKKIFNSTAEYKKYVDSYTCKTKTELCQNWEAYSWCKFGDKCSFAHGEYELRKRTDVRPSFKVTQCRQFLADSFCPYGTRCQFIHTPLSPSKQENVSYVKMLADNLYYVKARVESLKDNKLPIELDTNTLYVSAYTRRRLEIFTRLEESRNVRKN